MDTEPGATSEHRPNAHRVGEVVGGKYVVERVIGFGGMGTVVAANDTLLNRLVAIKFLQPEIAAKPAAIGRFLREARAAAGLQSEHVVRIIDAGTSESGAPYIVMEYLEGKDLSAYLASAHPIAVADAVDLLLQAGEAVAEAHAIGIVHRDLKPSNLFVTTDLDGRRKVKVLDFGISMFVGPSKMSDGRALTGTGDLVGSPLYMSPEQVRDARRVTSRTDIWALGVILYELMADYSPFQAETMTAICAHIVSDPPPPIREKRPDVPKKLEEVILACLEKDEEKRIATLGELARRLAPFASDPRAARRIMAIASRETRVAVTPSGRGRDSVDTDGPTVAAPDSGWGKSLARREERTYVLLGLVGIAILGGAAATGISLFRNGNKSEAREATSAASATTTTTTPSSAQSASSGVALVRHEAAPPVPASVLTPASSATSAPASSASAVSAAPRPHTRPPSSAPVPSVTASATPTPAPAEHPTIDQAMDSRQ